MLSINLTSPWHIWNTQGPVATRTADIQRLARGGQAHLVINELRILSVSLAVASRRPLSCFRRGSRG